MENENVTKILNVWETNNKIRNPVKNELYLDIIDQVASLFAAGSYYYYILNFTNLEMEFVHQGIKNVLGIQPNEFSINKLFQLMHPEDLAKMHEKEKKATDFLFNNIPNEDVPLYKVVYLMRLRNSNGNYKTILHQVKALTISEGGKIQQVIGVHTDVSYLNIPFDHKISFISQQRPSYYSMNTNTTYKLVENSFKTIFTKREKEIIKEISKGKNFNEIAENLFVSPHTVNTHKKNILRKAHCKNTAELMATCLREGVI
jgi:DNA-binding CsgD family transcriptional regulator